MISKKVLLVNAVLLAFLLSGCGADGNDGRAGVADTRATDGGSDIAGELVGTAPISDGLAKTRDCMEEQGLLVEYDGRGGLRSPSQTPEQGELWIQIYSECGEAAGVFAPLTESELGELYRLEVENYECLIEHGFESEEPPTEQSFIDSWLRNDKPYQSIAVVAADTAPEVFIDATQVCPAPLWSFG